MRDRAMRRALGCSTCIGRLCCHLSLCWAVVFVIAAAVGDRIELNAAHPAGAPFHQEPQGTHDFHRLPDSTRALVIDVTKSGQWLK